MSAEEENRRKPIFLKKIMGAADIADSLLTEGERTILEAYDKLLEGLAFERHGVGWDDVESPDEQTALMEEAFSRLPEARAPWDKWNKWEESLRLGGEG